MKYLLHETQGPLTSMIKSFWMIDSEGDETIRKEKIIPDGYPEMIFHYQDPFRANINRVWHLQKKALIAGQIRNYFYLENTGATGMFAIKFQPWALKVLFDLDMQELTDNAVGIKNDLSKLLTPLKQIAYDDMPFTDKVAKCEVWFENFMENRPEANTKVIQAAKKIIENKGGITLQELCDIVGVSQRSLERYFKSYIGVSPKFYCRIIRFSSIFELLNEEKVDWSDVSYLAGFYDQSHFIKNFKEFTGEEPTRYGFSEENMANFFLKK